MGSGLSGQIDGRHVAAGSRDLLLSRAELSPWELRAIRRASWRSALIVFVAVDGRLVGALLLADELRADTPRAIRLLRDAGIARMRRSRVDPRATLAWRVKPRASPPRRSPR